MIILAKRKCYKPKSKGSGLINAGIYHLNPEVFKGIKNNSFVSLEDDIFPDLSSSGKLNGIILDGNFIDIGVPKDYTRYCEWIEEGKVSDL